eukprot:364711-Chlamydomonas_euryale.AAC.2
MCATISWLHATPVTRRRYAKQCSAPCFPLTRTRAHKLATLTSPCRACPHLHTVKPARLQIFGNLGRTSPCNACPHIHTVVRTPLQIFGDEGQTERINLDNPAMHVHTFTLLRAHICRSLATRVRRSASTSTTLAATTLRPGSWTCLKSSHATLGT